MQKIGWLLLVLASGYSNAALQQMDNTALQEAVGQGGADISLQLRINHTSSSQFDSTACAQFEFCRVAISVNNRFDGTNKKQWLVFKGFQGTINIPEIQLDGTDLVYFDDSAVSTTKPAVKLSFDPDQPIQFKNVGFQSLSIETDTVAAEGPSNTPGYLAKKTGGSGVTAYANGKYTNATNAFDFGREVGFTGLVMNANLSIAGSLKVFSCDSTHPRC